MTNGPKADELELMKAINGLGSMPRAAAAEIGMSDKRLGYILGKWSDKGWYEYGVNVALGWLTPSGAVALQEAIGDTE